MNDMDIFTFRKADGTVELNVSLDSELGLPYENAAAYANGADRRSNCCTCFWAALIVFGFIGLSCAAVVATWAWNTVHVRTATLAGGQMEMAMLSFDRWPIAVVIVALLAAMTICFQICSQLIHRLSRFALENLHRERDMRRSLVEKALEFAKPEKDTPKEGKWTINISVNKNSSGSMSPKPPPDGGVPPQAEEQKNLDNGTPYSTNCASKTPPTSCDFDL